MDIFTEAELAGDAKQKERKELIEFRRELTSAQSRIMHCDELTRRMAPIELGNFYLCRFEEARERWIYTRDSKDKNVALLALNKAIHVFYRRSPHMLEKILKKAAMFGNELDDKSIRNLSARIFYLITEQNL